MRSGERGGEVAAAVMTPPGPLLASIYGLYLLAVITPGPNTFIVTRLALSATRRHAARAVLGIALGNAAWLCVTLGGVAVLLQQVPGGMRAVRYAGGLYLLYLGVRGLRSARTASRAAEAAPAVAPETALVGGPAHRPCAAGVLPARAAHPPGARAGAGGLRNPPVELGIGAGDREQDTMS